LKRGFGRQTSSRWRWRFSQKNDWIVQVIPQQAIKAIPVLSTRKIVTRRQKLGWHFLHFTTALGLYGGVLWSGELQGLITIGIGIEMAPIACFYFLLSLSPPEIKREKQREREAVVGCPPRCDLTSHVLYRISAAFWIATPPRRKEQEQSPDRSDRVGPVGPGTEHPRRRRPAA
jgi:hypothetical protein